MFPAVAHLCLCPKDIQIRKVTITYKIRRQIQLSPKNGSSVDKKKLGLIISGCSFYYQYGTQDP